MERCGTLGRMPKDGSRSRTGLAKRKDKTMHLTAMVGKEEGWEARSGEWGGRRVVGDEIWRGSGALYLSRYVDQVELITRKS